MVLYFLAVQRMEASRGTFGTDRETIQLELSESSCWECDLFARRDPFSYVVNCVDVNGFLGNSAQEASQVFQYVLSQL
jgi:hypothetical protein